MNQLKISVEDSLTLVLRKSVKRYVKLVANQLQKAKQKQQKLTFRLGRSMYNLYKTQAIRFLYTSEGVKQEGQVKKLLRLLDYLGERMQKLKTIRKKSNRIKFRKKGIL